ncbi:MAG: hypothetical protein LIO94_04915 [Clostridiales bacterium]|nr:hypothetical protein [Clostridiales bacterium]
MYKHYGLTGQTVKVRRKKLGETDAEPWAYGEQDMKIEGEYEHFLTATVLPHKNPSGTGISKPYPVTIHKFDIQCGDILINGGEIR